MREVLSLDFEPGAREDLVAELGSFHAFEHQLALLLERESDGRASLAIAPHPDNKMRPRGGVIEIITAVSGLIVALTPIVVAWIKSRGFEAEEVFERRSDGTVVRKLRVRRGSAG